MNTYTAIDFETAQGNRWSICQVGLVRVVTQIISEQLSILVHPPENYYDDRLIDIQVITPERTRNVPTFDHVWEQIEPYISNQNVVAHNGFSFDYQCLKQSLAYYSMTCPKLSGHCTYRIFGEKLSSLYKEHKIPLNHHDTPSDSRACAELFLIYLRNN